MRPLSLKMFYFQAVCMCLNSNFSFLLLYILGPVTKIPLWLNLICKIYLLVITVLLVVNLVSALIFLRPYKVENSFRSDSFLSCNTKIMLTYYHILLMFNTVKKHNLMAKPPSIYLSKFAKIRHQKLEIL